jgi:all-trans-retinol 13,14-reductase
MLFYLLLKYIFMVYIPYFIYQCINKTYFSKNRLTTTPIKSIEDGDYTKTRYTPCKVPKDIDVIVIGSGIGGLTTGALLAKAGKKVLVLEQHYIAGGTTHSFEDKGVEHETGLHYIGNIEKRKPILDLISYNPIEWCKLGWEREDERFIYDEIFIGQNQYEFEAGEKNLVSYLMERFPYTNKSKLETYFSLIKKAAKKDMFFISKMLPFKCLAKLVSWYDSEYTYYCETSAYDVVKTLFDDDELIAVLFGQFGDYGMTPKTASFFIHASIVNHYLEGGWFPKGGTGVIANEICKTIKQYGGEVLVGKAVKEIAIDGNGAYGVIMDNDELIKAHSIVSAVGVRNTFHSLIKNKKYPTIYDDMLDKMPPSVQHMYCFVKLDGSPKDLKLRSSNFWIYPHNNYQKVMEDYLDDPLNAPIPLFMGFSCMKDESWSEKYPGVSNAIILSIAKKEWFDSWENERCMKRGKDYEGFKKQIGDRMLDEGLFRFYPELREKVLETNIGTPLSTQFYLNAHGGESYGLDMNLYRLTQSTDLRPTTDINGLYLTGQDICTLGVTGAMMAGVLTANVVAGYDNMTDIVLGNNIVKDLQRS